MIMLHRYKSEMCGPTCMFLLLNFSWQVAVDQLANYVFSQEGEKWLMDEAPFIHEHVYMHIQLNKN